MNEFLMFLGGACTASAVFLLAVWALSRDAIDRQKEDRDGR